jgi:hypothetical protein
MENKIKIIFFIILIFSLFCPRSLAIDVDDLGSDSGIELEEIITLGSSLLATALFLISFIAYRRDGRKRLLYVTIAFFLFAVKGYLSASDLFFPEREWMDPVVSFFDFAILLSFFFGISKK